MSSVVTTKSMLITALCVCRCRFGWKHIRSQIHIWIPKQSNLLEYLETINGHTWSYLDQKPLPWDNQRANLHVLWQPRSIQLSNHRTLFGSNDTSMGQSIKKNQYPCVVTNLEASNEHEMQYLNKWMDEANKSKDVSLQIIRTNHVAQIWVTVYY
jgi:hypothetical protein